jgi:hypothetical protein
LKLYLGIKFQGDDLIRPSSPTALQSKAHHYYELCAETSVGSRPSGESLIVELEQCYGKTVLYACADNNLCAEAMPTAASWAYYSDDTTSCTHSFDPRVKDQCHSPISQHRPTLALPQRVGNYFLLANGTGQFVLRVQTTLHGIRSHPQMVFTGMQGDESSRVTVKAVTGNTAALEWRQSRVFLPGAYTPLEAAYMTYVAYLFDSSMTDAALQSLAQTGVDGIRLTTPCGLDYITDTLVSTSKAAVKLLTVPVSAADQGGDTMSHTLTRLKTGTSYRVVVVATCDSDCLRQLSKVTDNPRITISCSDQATDCRSQSSVYSIAEFITNSRADSDSADDDASATGNDDTSTYVQSLISFSFVVLALIIVAIVGASAYWLKDNSGEVRSWLESVWLDVSGYLQRSGWAAFGDDEVGSGNGGFSSHGLTARGSGEYSGHGGGASSGSGTRNPVHLSSSGGGGSFFGLAPRGGKGDQELGGVELENYSGASKSGAEKSNKKHNNEVGGYAPPSAGAVATYSALPPSSASAGFLDNENDNEELHL